MVKPVQVYKCIHNQDITQSQGKNQNSSEYSSDIGLNGNWKVHGQPHVQQRMVQNKDQTNKSVSQTKVPQFKSLHIHKKNKPGDHTVEPVWLHIHMYLEFNRTFQLNCKHIW